MASAGTVTVDFAAETTKFTAELQKVNKRLGSLEGGFATVERAAKAAIGVLSVGALTSFVRSSAEAVDAFGKMADTLDVSTSALKTFQIAGGEAGVSLDQTNKLLVEAQKRLGEAATGTGEAAKFIELLGLNVRELQSLSPDELFRTYAESITSLASRSEQLAAANALMGKSAQQAFALIQAGTPAIDEAAAFVERYGLALDRVEIMQIEQANDALGRTAVVAEAAGQRIAAGLAPAVEHFANVTLSATGNTRDLQVAAEQFGSVTIVAFEIVSNAANSLQAAFYGIAAAGARVFQALTFGDVSESFAASVDANLAKANEALSQIKSIEQIQQTVVQALEESRRRAEESVAERAAQDAAAREGGLSIAGESIGLSQQQHFDMINAAAEAAADTQIDLEREVTRSTLQELDQRAQAASNWRDYERMQAENLARTEVSLRQQVSNAALSGIALLATRSKTWAKIQKTIQIAQAIRDTYVGITHQLTSGDPYTAIPRAVAVGAFGFLQVDAIQSTPDYGTGGFSGGISGSSGVPSATAPNPVFSEPSEDGSAPGATSQPAVQVIVTGNVGFDDRIIDQIMDGIRQATDGRDAMLFGPDSRQAQEIRGA